MSNLFPLTNTRRRLAFAVIVILVAAIAWSLIPANDAKEKPMAERHEAPQKAVTLDMINDLKNRLDALKPVVTQLTERMQVLSDHREAVEASMTRQAGEYRDVQVQVEKFQTDMAGLTHRLDDVVPRVSQLEQAAEAAKTQPPEPEPKVDAPFTISGVIRWGEQALVIAGTPGGYRSLGIGDGLNGWQVTHIDTANDQVTLRHLASGREVVQSLWNQGETPREAADEN